MYASQRSLQHLNKLPLVVEYYLEMKNLDCREVARLTQSVSLATLTQSVSLATMI